MDLTSKVRVWYIKGSILYQEKHCVVHINKSSISRHV